MSGDGASSGFVDGAASHNVLSGQARSAAQVHTVFGGVHMYDTSPPHGTQRPRRRRALTRREWVEVSFALVAVAVSLASLLFALRRVMPSGQNTGDPPTVADMNIPRDLRGAHQHYMLKMPEIVDVNSFQVYPCGRRIYSRVLVGATQIPRPESSMESVARRYGNKLADATWFHDEFLHYEQQRPTMRRFYEGSSMLFGVELFGAMSVTGDETCGIDLVAAGVLVLDYTDTYIVVVVLLGTNNASAYAYSQAIQDVKFILDSILIDIDQ